MLDNGAQENNTKTKHKSKSVTTPRVARYWPDEIANMSAQDNNNTDEKKKTKGENQETSKNTSGKQSKSYSICFLRF